MDPKKQSEELILTVKPGTKVKVVESKTAKELKDRDISITAPGSLRIAVKRVQAKGMGVSHSSITMCG
jgi:hypothetical protein